MDDKQLEDNQKVDLPRTPDTDDVVPDELMSEFRGKSLGKIIIFTVLVHGIFIGVFSLGGLFSEELTEEQQVDRAVEDGMKALRDIAERYEAVTVNDLAARLAGDKPRAADSKPQDGDDAADDTAGPDQTDEPAAGDGQEDDGISDYQRAMEVKEDGPKVPDLDVDDEEDLFAPETP
jgi:hypothetical protein